jgi:hypothetical protein
MKSKLKETEVAEILNVSIGTLRRMRQDGSGPPWMNLRGSSNKALVRYDYEELKTWLDSMKQTSNAA